jgi:hypothetical protein
MVNDAFSFLWGIDGSLIFFFIFFFIFFSLPSRALPTLDMGDG